MCIVRIDGLNAWRVSDVVDFNCVHRIRKAQMASHYTATIFSVPYYCLNFYTCFAGALKSDWLVLLSS